MKSKRIASIILVAAVLLSGCNTNTDITTVNTEVTTTTTATATSETTTVPTTTTTTTEPEPVKFEFNPHLYVPTLLPDIPQDYWESFYNLCDALREGSDTFQCSSREAYEWATDSVTLTELFPAACMMITPESGDGSKPFENGTGKISYTIPAEEYVERQKAFEKYVEEVINGCVEYDDTDFEKCLKLYDYMETNFTYEKYPGGSDGANYYTFMNHTGVCNELCSVYAYYLLQVGIEAFHVGCFEGVDHAWTYMVINGKGYYSDPTWALKGAGDPLGLYYFIMNADRRVETGCPVDDLTAPLLPKYWFSQSKSRFEATDGSLSFPQASFLDSIDEDNKTVIYTHDSEKKELKYS